MTKSWKWWEPLLLSSFLILTDYYYFCSIFFLTCLFSCTHTDKKLRVLCVDWSKMMIGSSNNIFFLLWCGQSSVLFIPHQKHINGPWKESRDVMIYFFCLQHKFRWKREIKIKHNMLFWIFTENGCSRQSWLYVTCSHDFFLLVWNAAASAAFLV